LAEIIEGTEFLKNKNLPSVLKNLTLVADEIIEELIQVQGAEELKVLALGKWGGQELGFRSDLDFIFVLNDEPTEKHFKMARRMISRLTEPHKGGSLYAIDMRLKPSGKAGPLIVKKENLIGYLQATSEPWERQAYLRGRGILWDAAEIRAACFQKRITSDEMKHLNQIRQQLVKPSLVDLKYSEGGLLDLELFAQTFLLHNNIVPSDSSTIGMLQQVPGAPLLVRNYSEIRLIEQLLHLISFQAESDLSKKDDSIQVLAALFNKSHSELMKYVISLIEQNVSLLNELDPRRGSS
jgi:glutamate-ammonia-ligase adenylyltransferase